jgi:hypothetical protein
VNTAAVKVIIDAEDDGVIANRSTFGPSVEGCEFAWETVEWAVAEAAVEDPALLQFNW